MWAVIAIGDGFDDAQVGAIEIGSGLKIFEYDLDDGSKIRLGFPGDVAIVYARHVTKDGKTVDLLLK